MKHEAKCFLAEEESYFSIHRLRVTRCWSPLAHANTDSKGWASRQVLRGHGLQSGKINPDPHVVTASGPNHPRKLTSGGGGERGLGWNFFSDISTIFLSKELSLSLKEFISALPWPLSILPNSHYSTPFAQLPSFPPPPPLSYR